MLTKSEIKLYGKLNQKKFRDLENKFLIEGKRLIEEGLNSSFNCIGIFLTEEFLTKEKIFVKSLVSKKINFEKITQQDLNKITSTQNPQGIAAVFEIPKEKNISANEKVIVALENISDPGNLGTILRSCDWFGIKTVLLSDKCTDLYNPKVLRASMGAFFNLNIIENVNLVNKADELKNQNYKILCADIGGADYAKQHYPEKYVITFCNEAFGPSEELKAVCDTFITIPKKGKIESLNVAAAAAVILSKL